jgi:hypothetical protein
MSKPTRFIPHLVKATKKWVVNVPAIVSPNGKRRRIGFNDRESALKVAAKYKSRLRKFGSSLANMDPVRLGEASEAYKLIDAHTEKTHDECTLYGIVRQYIAQHQARNQSVTLDELFDQYLAAKAHLNPKYIRQLRHCRSKFVSVRKVICDLDVSDLQPILDSSARGTRDSFIRYLRAIFEYGIKKRYLKENPARKIDRSPSVRTEIQTFSNDVIKGMLERSLQRKIELVPYLVLTAFMGVRPEDEAFEVLWGDLTKTSRS